MKLRVKPLAALAGVMLLAGCVSAPTVASPPSASPSAPAAPAAPSAAACTDATESYPPSTSSAYAGDIRKRGFLVVGVSADTNLLGAVVPGDPRTFQGFDIDMARAVAQALFPGKQPDSVIRFKVISAADRIPQLTRDVNAGNVANGGVDLVARAFTMNCARWTQINFSGVYFNATQKLLVPAGSSVTGVAALPKGSRVCAPTASTSLEALSRFPNVTGVGVANHTDCLAQLQQGRVDAITGDDAILAGFRAQDPQTKVLPAAFGDAQPYGLGVPKAHPDFAAFVNGVLEGMRQDGSWTRSYDRWLRPALDVAGRQPAGRYDRPLP